MGNNPYTKPETIDLVMRYGFALQAVEINEGAWEGEPEQTLVLTVAVGNTATVQQIEQQLSYLCSRLNQDAIAYMIGAFGKLVFNDSYQGERYEFNSEYFKFPHHEEI